MGMGELELGSSSRGVRARNVTESSAGAWGAEGFSLHLQWLSSSSLEGKSRFLSGKQNTSSKYRPT